MRRRTSPGGRCWSWIWFRPSFRFQRDFRPRSRRIRAWNSGKRSSSSLNSISLLLHFWCFNAQMSQIYMERGRSFFSLRSISRYWTFFKCIIKLISRGSATAVWALTPSLWSALMIYFFQFFQLLVLVIWFLFSIFLLIELSHWSNAPRRKK